MRLGMIGFAGLFSGSFWSGFRYQTPQAIEDQLKKQNPSLANLLNQEEVIQEVKTGSNTKLQQFFANNLFKMIDLITVMPDSDEHQRGHKFPFVAAQILNCDSQIILDAFFKPPLSQDKVKEKQEEDESLSENQDFEADNQEMTCPNNIKQRGIANDVPPIMDNDDDDDDDDDQDIDSSLNQQKRYQDDDGEDEEFNKFQQEEENDDKGPLLIKDIDGEDEKDLEVNLGKKQDYQKQQQNVEKINEKTNDDAQDQENNEKIEKLISAGVDEEDSDPKTNDQETFKEFGKNDDKDAVLFQGDEEEKMTPSLQTLQSTTCETQEKYRFQHLVYLFKFLQLKENRPSSPASSLASQTTTATNTEQDSSNNNNENTISIKQQDKKVWQNENELNNVLCGYFAKLVIHFVIKRPKQFFTFLSERPQSLYSMTKHLYSRAIADALMKILICQNHGIEDSGMSLYQQMRKNVIEKVLGYIDIVNSPNGIQNAVNILAELASRKPCLDILVQPQLLGPFFAKLFDGIDDLDKKTQNREEDVKKTASSSIVREFRRQGIRLLSWLMQQYRNLLVKQASKNEEDKKENKEEDAQKDENGEKQDKANFTDDDEVVIGSEIEEYDKTSDEQYRLQEKQDSNKKKQTAEGQTPQSPKEEENNKAPDVEVSNEPSPLIQSIYENFDNLIKFLNIKPIESIDTITGKVMQPFGAIRLSLIQIIVEAVRINENALNNKIVQSKILTKLLHFFGEYEWNSLLHFKLDLMFLHIINNSESYQEVLHSVIEQSHLIEYVLQLAKADLYKLQNKMSREIERGFFPYILRIMESLKRQSEKSTYLKEHLKSHEQEWNLVWAQKIEPKQKKYAKQLGGVNPNLKKNQNNNQADNLILPSSLSGDDDSKKQSDDDINNNKFSSFDKKGNHDDDDDDQNPENEPEEEIRNKGDMDDEDDQIEHIFSQNSRYSSNSGGNRAKMLSSNDSYQRHKDLYVQTHSSDDDDQEDDGLSFPGWNVDDPQLLLQKESRSKKNKKKIGSDLNQAFDSKRDAEQFPIGHNYQDQDPQDFAGFEFNYTNNMEYSSGEFSANEFGQFQKGEEFYDAKDSNEDQEEDSDESSTKMESAEFNDFNFWRPTPQYDLSQLMNEM